MYVFMYVGVKVHECARCTMMRVNVSARERKKERNNAIMIK